MGSTLTNTQPKDTYKSLLKTSDSSELSATAKLISDGNGNDSALALSTSAVGIGTASPIGKLNVNGGTGDTIANDTVVTLNRTSSTSNVLAAKLVLTAPNTYSQNLVFKMKTTASSAENPSYYSDVVAITNNGLTFNGDTAAANALDDYEEGTWTPVISDGTNNATMTDTYNEGKYIKIGKMVHLSGYVLTDSLGSVTGNIRITGLPFTNSSGFGYLVGGVAGAGGNLNLTSGQNITLTISTGSNYIILNVWDATTGSNQMTASQWSADGQIQVGITYLAS